MTCPTIIELRKDTAALKQLTDLLELGSVPPEQGGFYFSESERRFIKNMIDEFDTELGFTEEQRRKIGQIWITVELTRRPGQNETASNLFSKLSPERQAEQRARAAKVKLPWEK